ncbi:abortive infection system antitoxin AbiGi family protein [Aliivibrio fischeri]|uniref:abortive infection system antitoxin AbiGi family protein n=1 Tax=Aliivibrio fischeri TaxID=668 RepID=UPI0012DA94C0|nr:abortive infection system antitoxin AbiGi family protein [Aliivibrio fischeri]
MQPKSHTLFHFTKNISFLQDILLNGFWPRFCLEDASWYGYSGTKYYLAYPMVCFCDIPLSRVDQHVQFYGNYGIGVTRTWAESNGLSPVLYLRESSQQHVALNNLILENLDGKNYAKSSDDINTLLAHIKPTFGTMKLGNELIDKEFYQENEWRYSITKEHKTKQVAQWLSEEDFRNSEILEIENTKTKNHESLKILPSDIKYLFVKTDSDIPELVNFIQTKLDHYPSHDVKILLSRIISLETISRDL